MIQMPEQIARAKESHHVADLQTRLCPGALALVRPRDRQEPARTPSRAMQPDRTSWGAPDIQGIWDFRTLTPLERPEMLADKAVLSPAEARAFQEQAVRLLNVDERTGEAAVDVEKAYNNFWFDWGTEINEDLRTSLLIDPPNGRLPEITDEALVLMDKHNRLRMPPVRDLYSFSADITQFRPEGPESLGLSERCLLGLNAGPPLTPSAYNNNLRIVQTPNYVVLVTEMIHDARIVPIGGPPRLPTDLPRWSGDSRGQLGRATPSSSRRRTSPTRHRPFSCHRHSPTQRTIGPLARAGT